MAETYRSEYVKCGKAGCRKCPHGPYWYAYWREGSRTRKRYIGKVDPRKGEDSHPHDDIFSRSKANLALACEILGIGGFASPDQAKLAFRRLSRECHPDRGGDERAMSRINAAYSYFRSVCGC